MSGDWIDRVTKGEQSVPYKIYQTETPNIFEFSKELFEHRAFDQYPETKYFDPEQVQLLMPSIFSDTTWIASDEVRVNLQKHSCIAYIKAAYDEDPVP